MIYSPVHYKENRSDLVYEIIKDYSFATIVTQSEEGPVISQLPLLLEVSDRGPSLLGHCARANPQWKHFAEGQKLTILFHGPHSYISPAWYEPKSDNVPTWNYATIHVQGIASIVSADEEVFEVLQKTVQQFENQYETGWSLPDAPNEELSQLLRHIVAFRIDIEDIQAKFKLSQKQSAFDRNKVIQNLSRMSEEQQAVAQLMRDVVKHGDA